MCGGRTCQCSEISRRLEKKKARRRLDEKCGFGPFVQLEKYIALYSLGYCHAKRRGDAEKEKNKTNEAPLRPDVALRMWHASVGSDVLSSGKNY